MKNCPGCGSLIQDARDLCEACRRKESGPLTPPPPEDLLPPPEPAAAPAPAAKPWKWALALGTSAICLYAAYRGCSGCTRKFESLFAKATQNQTRGQLGGLRSALSIYYGDLEGVYPDGLDHLTKNSKYIGSIPRAHTLVHEENGGVVYYDSISSSLDTGGWGYVNDPGSGEYGTLFVDCTHTDLGGKVWASY